MLSGMLAGLVAITPAAGFVNYGSAVVIAIIGGICCYFAINYIKVKLKYNDALDAFGIHGIGGVVGAILTAVFQSHSVNSSISDGVIFGGNFMALVVQIVAVIVTIVFSGVVTYCIAKVISFVTELGTSEVEEEKGLDSIVHGENAYFNGELNKLNRRY